MPRREEEGNEEEEAMTEKQQHKLKPVNNLNEVTSLWRYMKSTIEDTECCGETWDFLSEWVNPETGTAQHALWRGCETIVAVCHKINNQINMAYPHPIGESTITLTPALQDYYAARSTKTGKPINTLVLSDLTALLKKRVAREEKGVWKENEYERL
jgi:hypothetical protein